MHNPNLKTLGQKETTAELSTGPRKTTFFLHTFGSDEKFPCVAESAGSYIIGYIQPFHELASTQSFNSRKAPRRRTSFVSSHAE